MSNEQEQRIAQLEREMRLLKENFFKNNFAGSQRFTKLITMQLGNFFNRIIATGLTTLNIKAYTNFENSTRFSSTVGGSGGNTFDAGGLYLRSGATGTSFAKTQWTVTIGMFKTRPTFSAVISTVNLIGDIAGTDDRQRFTDIKNIHTALASYKTTNGNYPTALSALVPTYLASVPVDPLTGSAYSYAYKDDFTDAHIGATLQSASASYLTSDEDFDSNIAGWTGGFNGSDPILDFRLESTTDPGSLVSPSGSGSAFFGLGEVTVTGTAHTFTTAGNSFAGFYFQKTDGVISLYAVQSDGSGVRTISSALTTSIADTDTFDLILKVNSPTNIEYYWRKNGGSLSAKTTLSATMPTTIAGLGGNNCQFSTSNEATANNFDFYVVSSSYER